MTRVLLVDDDESNRITLAVLLEDEGFAVDEAGSYGAANARLAGASAAYDLVLLDEHLGDGLGSALLPAVRARAPSARAIQISGSVEGLEHARDDYDACIPKGMSFPEILAIVRATLAGRGRA